MNDTEIWLEKLDKIEGYLSDTVHHKFHRDGFLDAFDFFCIIIWKANRAKSKTAHHIIGLGSLPGNNLNERVRHLTKTLFRIREPKERLRYLMKDLEFRLPTASAILTVLYPEEFTVYDERVCGELPRGEEHSRLANKSDYDSIWNGYRRYMEAVVKEAPDSLSLRDKDRYLWGRSFYIQLSKDLANEFRADKNK